MAVALETYYRGITFRSRLEARWAVFFDWMHIRWEYEKEGYDLDGVWYLPDFWLPQFNWWIEIKGKAPDELEQTKAARLSHATGHDVYLFNGSLTFPPDDPPSATWWSEGEWRDDDYWWCECPDCGQLGIEYNGRADRLPCKECLPCWYETHNLEMFPSMSVQHHQGHKEGGCPRHGGNGDKGYNYHSTRLVTAYEAALSERFGT